MKTNISYISAIILHVAIGFLVYLNEGLAKIYFLFALVYFFARIIVAPSNLKTFEVLKACAYFVGAEVLFRMTKGAFSYEAGKYLVILFVLVGMFYRGLSGKGYPYFIYLMFLIPSIFVASTTLSFDAHFRTNIAFVLSGPVCLGLAALFCYDKRVTFAEMSSILYFMVLPIIAHTVYIYFYTPNLREVLSGTGSNHEASGGFGPNQVSAILGLGMILISIRLFIKSPSFSLKILNSILLIAISFRAVSTFSRGGVLAAILTILVFLFSFYKKVSIKKKNEIIGVFTMLCISLVTSWMISSYQSDGLIDLRYANKDVLGREKQDITTGRGQLFKEELEGFVSHPFLGIGSSRAKDQRIEEEGQGITSHSEFSRTLAEHGIFGVVILIILIFKPFAIRSRNQQNYYFYAFLAFWFLTINHMSMRIAMPAFIYALALLNVTHDKNPLHRKQLDTGNV
ncbi:O-antigen ligase family protein [Subsaxibacter sp. CAU 1640]|uniref:O-antigen ligase family protein n=1 Tax=Subsaxibacter sp. CAU 1640 TaxID=2933271 RepID=UPI0020043A1C|nr:O-antigen ligase family protein [Subsaxibacter sp. CAU 1640]MCK7589882.1 O-antigen ligase family protein [Subsaxibacter sp. CAU 1640]